MGKWENIEKSDDDFMVYVTAVLKMGLELVPGEVSEKCIPLILSLFALVVHVTMVIWKILFMHVHIDIHEWDMKMQQTAEYDSGVGVSNKQRVL